MPEWLTYRLSDFLMFTPATYYRLFELHNAALWPTQLLAVALGLAILALARGSGVSSARAAMLLLALFWPWVGWAFHLRRFAAINLAAPWFAAAFALQGLLLLGFGLRSGRDPDRPHERRDPVGLGVMAFALLLEPLIGPGLGRSLAGIELAGMAPDPTAILTLGLLLAVRGPWPLWLIPILWGLVTGATLWAMGQRDAFVVPAVALVVGGRAGAEAMRSGK